MAASSSTFTAATPEINYCYDIFLNHRGPDVKKTFARSLYLRLTDKGLRVFLDQEELQAGYYFPPQIKQAIKTAKVHVAIFSPRYAESDWCLRELVMMLESKSPIIPIFYLVNPADLRRTNGKYAGDLQILSGRKTEEGKPRYDFKDIENWRAAISLVADYHGFELEFRNGEELQMELLDKLVESLLETVEREKKPDLHVAKYPTGLDEKLKDFEKTVLSQQQQTGKPQILGIVGLGGVGKTALANEFFNRKKSNYQRSCFLFDVRENAGKGSLNSLQRELLKSLTSIDVPIGSVEEGKFLLKECIRISKQHLNSSNSPENADHAFNVLIVLDDIDNADQVDALLPFDLSSGSLILIICRDKDVLVGPNGQSSSIYVLTGLNDEHSRELFCSHSFGQTYPLPGFESLVYRFLEACQGLPLSLKEFGEHLFGRDKSDWEKQLEYFCILLTSPTDSIEIRYKALHPEEKQMVLDVACFFEGLNKNTAISIWNESNWTRWYDFNRIEGTCLAEVDSFNRIQIRDNVKGMGRIIAEESSPHRLWRWTENVKEDLLQQSSIITARGIKMDLSEYNAYGGLLRNIDTSSLRIIDTEGFVLERILKGAELPSLLWLRWVDCPYTSLPSWIPMENLRYLELSGSLLNTLWVGESESQVHLQSPIYVEELNLNNCVKLKDITGLEQFTYLRRLSVSGCSELEELPSMEPFVFFEELCATGCVKLKSLRELRKASRLRVLDISGCSELEELPSMEAFVYLVKLLAAGCVKLKNLPELGKATRLRVLDISGCSEIEELPSMEAFVYLEELLAAGCVKLKNLPELGKARTLRVLDISGCSELKGLPCMGYWQKVKSIEQCVWSLLGLFFQKGSKY